MSEVLINNDKHTLKVIPAVEGGLIGSQVIEENNPIDNIEDNTNDNDKNDNELKLQDTEKEEVNDNQEIEKSFLTVSEVNRIALHGVSKRAVVDFKILFPDETCAFRDTETNEVQTWQQACRAWRGRSHYLTPILQKGKDDDIHVVGSDINVIEFDIYDTNAVVKMLNTIKPCKELREAIIKSQYKAIQSFTGQQEAYAMIDMVQKQMDKWSQRQSSEAERRNAEVQIQKLVPRQLQLAGDIAIFQKHIDKYVELIEQLEVYRIECKLRDAQDFLVEKDDGVYDFPPNKVLMFKDSKSRPRYSDQVEIEEIGEKDQTPRNPIPIRPNVNVVIQNSDGTKLAKPLQNPTKKKEDIDRVKKSYEEDEDSTTEDSDNDDGPPEDDDSEGPPSEEEEEWKPEDLGVFRYEDTVGAWIFKHRVEKWGTLPYNVMSLMRTWTTGVNALNRQGYANAIANDPLIVKHLDYYQRRNNTEYEMFLFNLDAYFYHSASVRLETGITLSEAGSLRAEQQRQISRNLNNLVPLNGVNYKTVLKAMLAGGLLCYLLYKRWMRAKGRVGPHQIIPFFPKTSAFIEEVIKTIPGGWYVVSAIERVIYGDWHTMRFHKESASFPFRDRLKLHHWVNGCKRDSKLPWDKTIILSVKPFVNVVNDPKPLKHFIRNLAFLICQKSYNFVKTTKTRTWRTFFMMTGSWILNILAHNAFTEFMMGIMISVHFGFRTWNDITDAFSAMFFAILSTIVARASLFSPPPQTQQGQRMHQLIPGSGKYGVYLEEIIKTVPYGWKIVACAERVIHGDWKTWNWHKRSSNWSFSTRVKEHMKLNELIPDEKPQLLKEYEEHISLKTKKTFSELIEPMRSTKMPKFTLPKIQGATPKPYATFDNQQEKTPSKDSYWHSLFWCVNKMASPANTFENAAACIDERIRKMPNQKPSLVTNVYKSYVQLTEDMVIKKVKLPNWESSLRPIQKQNLATARKMREEGKIVNTIKTQLKCDEHIWFDEKAIPRFLVNGSKTEFLDLGKTTAEISTFVSEFLWGPKCLKPIARWKNGKLYVFMLYFTCGASSSSLSNFVNSIRGTGMIGIKVLGDDSHLQDGKDPKQRIVENDFKTFDRSQSTALRKPIDEMLKRCGFIKLVEGRKRMYKRNLKMFVPSHLMNTNRSKHLAIVDINGKKADMRYSGEAATCLDNSFVNGFSTMAVWMEVDGNPDLITQEYAKLGLTAKIKVVDISDSTYLKGTYIKEKTNHDVAWTRLPSFLLKFGKTQEDPNVILKAKYLTLNEKCRMLLKAQWLGYGEMRTNWFYKELDACFRNCTEMEIPVEAETKLESWQVRQDCVEIDDDEWNRFVLARYSITKTECEDFLKQLRTALTFDLPVLWHHPMILKFSVDY